MNNWHGNKFSALLLKLKTKILCSKDIQSTIIKYDNNKKKNQISIVKRKVSRQIKALY